ncbi:putative SAP domain protein [Aspergillus leporis]|jgi:SAP domain-containing ribonucleoprotein|uniref:Putative SAP domain protein n=1 Tax=Aspergillus leporis TaxID=41062 RepID=A0A5N5XCX8_9EURO|nr:putative SAP domain protein [Aspergillus leporis]
MATDYSKKTNAELVEILKSRSLPHTGKKAEMVARLQEDDNKAAPAAKTDNTEDVIDWEDDDVAAADVAAAKPSTEAGAAAIAAGGQGAVPNPVAVPNQEQDTDPAATNDLTVESKGAAAPNTQEGPEAATAAAPETTETAPAEVKPAPNYSIGLSVTDMEEELKKRKARAEKFGITEDSKAAIEEAERKLERAKRFGATPEDAPTANVSKLDEALSSEKPRKRGRSDNDQGKRGGKRRDFGGRDKNRRRGQGRSQGNHPQGQNQRSNEKSTGSGLSEKDRLALEARKKRFGTAA